MDNIKIAKICGLCGGCKSAINTALSAKQKHKNLTIYKEIVHNKTVNNLLKEQGINITDNLTTIDNDTTVVLRAHGEPLQTYAYLKNNNINFIDCTCNNVAQIHNQVLKFSTMGYTILLIGKHGEDRANMHPEVVGTIGWSYSPVLIIENEADLPLVSASQATNFYLACQTTFNQNKADQLITKINEICKGKNAELIVDKTICNAQQQINKSSIELAQECDIVLVVGGKNSSNTQELYKNLLSHTNAIFIEDISTWKQELDKRLIALTPELKIGITAGASTLKEELFELKNSIHQYLSKRYPAYTTDKNKSY